MMKLTKDELNRFAKLANLDLGEGKLIVFANQIFEILGYIEKIEKKDTAKISALNNITGLKNVFREDKITDSLTQDESLKNAPSTHKGYFKVKAIF